MERDEVAVLLHFIGKAYRVDYAKEDVEVWEALLHEYDTNVVMQAAKHHSQHEQYPPNPAALVTLAEQYRDEEARAKLAADRKAAATRCDGSRWLEQDDGKMRPCAACNPALWHIFSDPELHRKWSAGLQVPLPEELQKVNVNPCWRHEEPFVRDPDSIERLRAADWSLHRRDVS